MNILNLMLRLIPGTLLEHIYYSKFRNMLLPLYDYINKNETFKTYRIFKDILIEVNISKPAERAIPFNAYEPTITKKFLDILKEDYVVFDVGAWIGYYTVLAAKKAGKVIAIEPNKDNYQRIRRNVNLNQFSNVTTFNIAVGEKPSQGILIEETSSSTHKIVSEGDGNTVEIESLDNMINKLGIQEINMLIIDIEGYEYFALRGLENSLLDRAVKNLICEIHPDFIKEWNGLSENDVINLLSE
jgi:FkbM family methyltransferase